MNTTLDELSTEQLEKLLQERKKKETAEAERKRKAYETKKDKLVCSLVGQAKGMSGKLSGFKRHSFASLAEFYSLMKEYGDVAEANKGNFSLKSLDGTKKVEFSRQVQYSFDERANLADVKLKEFLAESVKQKDKTMYELITTLLERNAANEYDPRSIQELYKYEASFDHPLWKEAIKLFKEAYTESGTSFYARFFEQDSNARWQGIQLNFSSVNVPPAES